MANWYVEREDTATYYGAVHRHVTYPLGSRRSLTFSLYISM